LANRQRFEDEIKPMDKASEAIFALKPVTFRYKKSFIASASRSFGLIPEDVEKVNPDLIAHDGEGRVYTVRYDQVNAMLLNEFLKERRKVEKLEATVAQQHQDFEAAVAELKRQIQKMSAQLELSKATPQTVLNRQ
jgi:trimeric autotransporter adhesin